MVVQGSTALVESSKNDLLTGILFRINFAQQPHGVLRVAVADGEDLEHAVIFRGSGFLNLIQSPASHDGSVGLIHVNKQSLSISACQIQVVPVFIESLYDILQGPFFVAAKNISLSVLKLDVSSAVNSSVSVCIVGLVALRRLHNVRQDRTCTCIASCTFVKATVLCHKRSVPAFGIQIIRIRHSKRTYSNTVVGHICSNHLIAGKLALILNTSLTDMQGNGMQLQVYAVEGNAGVAFRGDHQVTGTVVLIAKIGTDSAACRDCSHQTGATGDLAVAVRIRAGIVISLGVHAVEGAVCRQVNTVDVITVQVEIDLCRHGLGADVLYILQQLDRHGGVRIGFNRIRKGFILLAIHHRNSAFADRSQF